MSIESFDPKQYIIIKGARVNNLKNIDVVIPRGKLTVITGLSGSGKSSLAFDTLFAEGQRRYVESLSAYARQFLGRMDKPEVDYIKGISPAIAIEQKSISKNPRSTVGTSTEIYEYIKLLYARIGKTYSPISGKLVSCHQVSDVIAYLDTLPTSLRAIILSPLQYKHHEKLQNQFTLLLQQGFSRLLINKEIVKIDDINEKDIQKIDLKSIYIVIDRVSLENKNEEFLSRVADSVQTAFFEGRGVCCIGVFEENKVQHIETFSDRFEADGMSFEFPSVNLFSFNNPYGACKTCEGYGSVIGISEDLVIPNKNLSVYDEAVVCWKGEKMSEWRDDFISKASKYKFNIHKPYKELSHEEKELLWNGNGKIFGINDFFKYVEEQTYKIQYRVMLSRYRGKTTCPDCKGTRLRKDANYVKICNTSISELMLMPVKDSLAFFKNICIEPYEQIIAKRLLIEINNRLNFLNDVGLGYLTLHRLSNTLSGGESQRINLATSLGSSLVGSMYILDEPSIGLHARDTQRLIRVLKRLRDIGNTVIVVEHDADIIKAADYIVDIGPLAGYEGGEVVFMGNSKDISQSKGLTASYLTGKLKVPIPTKRRKGNDYIKLTEVCENNLKNITVQFPLKRFTVITGVSGSGKTTLVKRVLYPALRKHFGEYGEKEGKYTELTGDLHRISGVEMVDQNPIGRSTRSNPATYVKAYDEIRALFAAQQLAKVRGYTPGIFSFNIPGGRCEECQGEGYVEVEMQFMANIHLLCESCHGKRFKDDVLDVTYKGKNIFEILELTIDEALEFFKSESGKGIYEQKIHSKLKPLADVGLGYLKLGQSSSTLSGGEAQRIKLGYFLIKGNIENSTLFIFDEPTTGLHFHDIARLLNAMNALLDQGHSLIVIEHNPDVIRAADWVIDLGPEGGNEGGFVVFEGTPEQLIHCENSYTGQFLRKHEVKKD